jgi:hypothetical protein
MAEFGEWNRKGAALSEVTAEKEYGVTPDFIVKGTHPVGAPMPTPSVTPLCTSAEFP